MSTRCSIIYNDVCHIWWDVNEDKIFIQTYNSTVDDVELSLEEAKELLKGLENAIKYWKNP